MNEVTKVLFVINSLSIGGAERVFSTLLSQINHDDFDVTLAVGVKTDGFLTEIPEAIKVVELGGSKRAVKSFIPLLKLIYTLKPDIVISTLGMIASSSLCSLFVSGKIRFIARFGNTVSADLYRSKRESYFKYLFQFLSYKLVVNRSEIVTQSQYMKNDLVDLFKIKKPEKISVIYNPTPKENVNVPQLRWKEGDPIKFITVGRFAWQKGYDILIESLYMLTLDNDNFEFHFIGGGDPKERLIVEKKVREYQLSNKVFFHGEQASPYDVVDDANIFVSSSRFEGFANVFLESIARGIPVVATDCPSGNREIIHDGVNGWLTEQNGTLPKAEEIKDTLLIAINSYQYIERKRISKDIYEKFSVKAIVNQFEALFLRGQK
ncbi:glycosyltransferase [Photobacterium swingsii]|uniref:glycosyltransferase n=1 Tax=Photobacterium swingsii TaxID=680026 RepID=UPI003D142E8D